MNRIFRFLIIVFVTLSATLSILFQAMPSASISMPKLAIELPNPVEVAQNIDFGRHFQELGVEGSILIYDSKNDLVFQHNPERNARAFLPASTFKILNSLIALETGVIPNEISVLTWDGIQRDIPEWNRDLNMKEAFKVSAVWFYQVLARRVGYEQMQKWVTNVGYGNQKIGNKDDIDKFWLQGELRITPQEQIQFLRRLYNNELPFSQRTVSIVKDIMIMEKTPDYTIRSKTGWAGFGDKVTPQIGWIVGYLEKGDNVYFFATNIDIRNNKDSSARMEVTRRCFKDMGVF
ncbi:class D beta-lactamase [Kamptonema animale CS-326]|jgi:beta-lactamase class D|uniref:class D beta-lactamase n=1 Tax=Kamptonema animale TaxID=92934 RepID=UPI00232E5739|nr:class D beta-lactamase [Kamptonema animale]MDB9512867.1 class D beta-lactamase [Kamptonema animale CS-326]